MGRGKRNLIDALAGLPWPVGLVVGALGYLTLAHGLPMGFAGQGGPLAQAFAGASNPFSLLGWLFFGMCVIGALASFLNARRTRRLLDTRTGLESIAALGWRDFERLVGEAFRRRGYSVEETGQGGAGGGIDLILHRDGRRILVQCKQWRCERVPVNVVRIAALGAGGIYTRGQTIFLRQADSADRRICIIEDDRRRVGFQLGDG